MIRRLNIGIVKLFCSVLLPFCVQAEPSPFKIGVLLCQSGPCAEPGISALNGLQMAREEINSSGGILGRKVEFVVEDSKDGESASHGVTAFKKLSLDSEISYFIGPTWSSAGVPLIPLIKQREDIIVTSPSLGVRDFNEASDRIFNTWPHDDIASSAVAEWAFKDNLRTTAIMSAEDPWCSAQAAAYRKRYDELGGKVELELNPLPSATDLRAEVLRIKSTNPDAVALILWNHAPFVARELRGLGYKGRFLAVQMDQERLRQGGKNFDGLIYPDFVPPSNDFKNRYQEKFKETPSLSADTAYDTLYLYKRAIEKAASFDTSKVKHTMLQEAFEGASGPIKFDPLGGVVKEPSLFKVAAGGAEKIG